MKKILRAGYLSVIHFLRKHGILLLTLTLLVGVVYFDALHNEFLSDDIATIQNNPNIGVWETAFTIPISVQNFIYPLAYKLSGLDPAGFRMLNILAHLGSVLTLYGIIYIQLRRRLVAFIIAAIFAVHPIFIESVTWISGGNYARYTFFFFVSFMAYLLSRKNWGWYGVSLVALLLSTFSSEKAVALPFLFVVYEFLMIPKKERRWFRLIPYVLCMGVYVLFYFFKIHERQVDVQSSSFGGGLFNPLIQIPTALSSYFILIFWPDKLALYHTELSFPMWDFLLRTIATTIYFLTLVYLFFKERFLFFWLFLFFESLSPTLTPIPLGWIFAERYAYLATAGIIVAVVYTAYKYVKTPMQQKVVTVIFLVIILALAARTVIRNLDWKNQDSLWVATDKVSPSSPVNHNNLGDMYQRHGDFKNAELQFKKAIEIDPRYAEAFHNLGNLYRQMKRYDEAIAVLQIGFALKPSQWQSPHLISEIYFDEKNYAKSLEYMKKSQNAIPNSPNVAVDVGIVYMTMQDYEHARQEFQYALQLDPENLRARLTMEQLPSK